MDEARRRVVGLSRSWKSTLPLTVLACQVPPWLVGMSFEFNLPAISRQESLRARIAVSSRSRRLSVVFPKAAVQIGDNMVDHLNIAAMVVCQLLLSHVQLP